MLKISQIESNDHSVTLKLEGRLVGPWVGEALEAVETFLTANRLVKLNLAEVSFVDLEGVKLLKKLIPRGVTLIGCSLFVQEQLKPPLNE